MRPTNPDMRRPSVAGRFFFREIWWLLLTAYAVVLFAGFFPQDFRNTGSTHEWMAWFAILVRNYLFHIGLVFAILAVPALLFRRFGLVICTLPLLLLTVGQELRDFRTKPPRTAAGETVTVMTFNLLYSSDDAAAVRDMVTRINADILLFQEYTERWHTDLHDGLKEKYPYILWKTRDDPYGIAVYSRRAFVRSGEKDRSGQGIRLGNVAAPQIRTVIQLDGQDVALYNLHLFPPLQPGCATTNRLQMADLLEKLATEKLPAIVAGDFNFTQRTPQGAALAQAGWSEAHSQAGKGRGGTWRMNPKMQWIPPLRMDHIYLSPQLTCVECRTEEPAGSDHLPVVAKIGFATGEGSGFGVQGSGPKNQAGKQDIIPEP